MIGRAAALVLAMILGACGDTGVATQAVEAVVLTGVGDDICPIVDAEDVKEIYAVDRVLLEEVEVDASMPTCVVTPGEKPAISVGWEVVRSYEELRDVPDLMRMNAPADLPGIGDRAFGVLNDELEDDLAQVHFEVDGQIVSVYGLPGNDELDPIREVRLVAESVAARVRFAPGPAG